MDEIDFLAIQVSSGNFRHFLAIFQTQPVLDTLDVVFQTQSEIDFLTSVLNMYPRSLLITLVADGLLFSVNQSGKEIFNQMQENMAEWILNDETSLSVRLPAMLNIDQNPSSRNKNFLKNGYDFVVHARHAQNLEVDHVRMVFPRCAVAPDPLAISVHVIDPVIGFSSLALDETEPSSGSEVGFHDYLKLLNDAQKEHIVGNVYSITCVDKVNVRRPCHLIWDLDNLLTPLKPFLENHELFCYCIGNNVHPASTKPSVFPVQILDENLRMNKNAVKSSETGKYAVYNSESGLVGHTYMLVARDKVIEVTREVVDLGGMFKIVLEKGKAFKHRVLEHGRLFLFETAKGKDTVWAVEKTGAETKGIAGLIKNLKKAEAPKIEAPKTEASKTEAPKTEAPKPSIFQQKFTKLTHFSTDGRQTDVTNSNQITISNGDILSVAPNMILSKIKPVVEARITDLHKIWLSTSIDPENGYFKIVISGNKQSKGGGFSCKKTVNRQVVTKIAGSEIDCESKLFDISLNHIFSKYSSVNICLDLGGAVDTLNSSKLEPVEINEKDANKVELTNFSFSGDIQMQFSCKLPEQDDRDVRTTPLVEYKMFINLCFQLSKYQNSLP